MEFWEGSVERQPIGYWLKRLDGLIDRSFDRVLADDTLTRRHWQVLNVIRREPATQPQLDSALAPFLTEAGSSTTSVVDDLRARGWVAADADRFMLTGAGEAACAVLQERVGANRARVTDGITAQEYAATIAVLARMCANLEQVSPSD